MGTPDLEVVSASKAVEGSGLKGEKPMRREN
jgi:hypothetical protein